MLSLEIVGPLMLLRVVVVLSDATFELALLSASGLTPALAAERHGLPRSHDSSRRKEAVVFTSYARATCYVCGEVLIHLHDLRCATPTDPTAPGLCEASCPTCGRLLLRKIDGGTLSALRQLGVGDLACAPLELLEGHPGPPLTYDDLLELHQALSTTCCPQLQLMA